MRVLAPAVLFGLGAAAGAGAVGLASNAAGSSPHLVAGQVITLDYSPSAADLIDVSVDVFNASDEELAVQPISIAGWADSGIEPAPQLMPARSWTAIAFRTLPECDVELTNVVVVGANSTPYEFVAGRHVLARLGEVRRDHCGLERRLFLEPEVISASIQDNALRMDLRLPAHGRTPIGEKLITNVGSPTPGFTVEVDGLPATLSADSPLALSTIWRVQDCRPADEGVIQPGITFITDDGFVVESWFGEHAVALLARYAEIHCTE